MLSTIYDLLITVGRQQRNLLSKSMIILFCHANHVREIVDFTSVGGKYYVYAWLSVFFDVFFFRLSLFIFQSFWSNTDVNSMKFVLSNIREW